jgi:hypothetical protein
MKAIDIIPEWEPMHAECTVKNPNGVRVEAYGIHCGCGSRLGWPPAGYALETEPDPDDWAAAAAEAKMAAEQERAEQDAGEVVPWEMPDSAVVPVDPIESALLAMDPTQPYTPADIELQLVSIVARLEQGQHFQREWEIKANAAAVAFELANALAIVQADGRSKEIREAQAKLACREEFITKMTTEATVKAVRESMHTLRSMLSGFQSIGHSVGASFNAPNFNR